MKKTKRLTVEGLKKLVRRIIKEESEQEKKCHGFDNDGEGNCVDCGHDEDSEIHQGTISKPLNKARIANAERDILGARRTSSSNFRAKREQEKKDTGF